MYAASTGHCGETQRYPFCWAVAGPLELNELSVRMESSAPGSSCFATSRLGGQKLCMIRWDGGTPLAAIASLTVRAKPSVGS